MNLFFLRHGEAGRRLPVQSKDSERPLTESGRKELEEIAKALAKRKVYFDKMVSSPLKRCHDSCEIVAKAQKNEHEIEDWEELKPEGNKKELLAKLSKLRQNSDVLLVGHEPYLSTLISELISGGTTAQLVMKKGGLAKVHMRNFAPRASGELRWHLTPRQIKNMG